MIGGGRSWAAPALASAAAGAAVAGEASSLVWRASAHSISAKNITTATASPSSTAATLKNAPDSVSAGGREEVW